MQLEVAWQRPVAFSRRRRDSCPSDEVVGGFSFEFEAVRTSRRSREADIASTPSLPRRASRSFPFISKTMNCNFISLATRVMLGQNAKPFQITTMDIDYV